MRSSAVFIVVVVTLLLGGCGLDRVLPDKRTEYQKSERLPDLEVPPDLTTDNIQTRMNIPAADGTATFSDFQQRQAGNTAERVPETRIEAGVVVGDGEHRIVVTGTADNVWPRLREFWKGLDYDLDIDQPERRMMETEWRENSAELVRDRFRITAEGQSGATALRVAHMGEELAPDGEDLDWRPRPRDATLERKLTERLAGFLEDSLAGPTRSRPSVATAARSAQGELAELVSAGEGKLYLRVQQVLADAWRTTGLALDQAGVTVEEADESRGIYVVRYLQQADGTEPKKKKRVWSRLAFWRKGDEGNQQFELSLTGVGEKTEVVVLNEDGEWDTSETAGKILVRLHRELNKLL